MWCCWTFFDYYDGLRSATILSATTSFDCVNGDCQCAQAVSDVQYWSSEFDSANNKCYCYVIWLNPATEQEEINWLTTSYGRDYDYDVIRRFGTFLNGSGKVKSTDASAPAVCYEFKGSNKSSKATKSPKSERDWAEGSFSILWGLLLFMISIVQRIDSTLYHEDVEPYLFNLIVPTTTNLSPFHTQSTK